MKKKADPKQAATSQNPPSPARERRAQVQAALRESEERFHLAFENANIGMALVGLDGGYLQVNQALSNMFGYSREELEKMKVRDLTHPDDLPRNRDFWRQALQEKIGSAQFEKRKVHKDGAVIWVHIASSLVRDTQGTPLYFVSQIQDITTRKLAEETLRRAHDELEQRVAERTASLRLANEQLLRESEERQQVENRLRESEARFTAFMEHLPGLAVMRDTEGRYLFANRAWEEMMRLKQGVCRGKTLDQIWPPERAAALAKQDFGVISSGKPIELLEMLEREDGPHHFLTHRFPILDKDGLPYMVGSVAIDITDRQRAEQQVKETGRLYRVLSQVNEAIIRGRDQESLYQQVCRIVVEEGLFRMAWVGLTNPLDKTIQVATKYGFDEGYLDNLAIPLAEGPESQGPTGTAVREDRYDICNDFATDPRMAPWRDQALDRGYRSSGAFPLRIGAKVVGALTLYASRPGFFTNQEINLLTSLADNLSFALESFDREARRQRAEEALADQAALVRDLYNQSPCGYHSLDREGSIVQINDTELALLGYTREEVVGRLKFSDLLTPESRKAFQKNFPGFKERGWVKDLEYEMVRKDGTVFPVFLSATAITDKSGKYLMSRSSLFDITDRKKAEQALVTERQRFLDLLENLPAFVYLQAPDYTLRFANRQFRERFGEPTGKTCYALLWGKDKPCPDCPTFSVFHTGQPKEWEFAAPDGRSYHVYDYPFADADGSPLVLEMGIDNTDRKKAEEALKGSESRLRYLAEQLLTAQENERKRLAAELHDELGHSLLALKLHLRSIEKKLPPEQEGIKEEIRAQLDYINEVIQDVRRLYHDLSPGDLEDLGLTKALGTLIDDFAGHVPHITWQVDLVNLEGLFSLAVQTIIYRTMQEALTNIGKHAHSTNISISAKKENQQVQFVVQDNGTGFEVSELRTQVTGRGVGLVAMEERLNMVGGSFEIHSREQEGTRLSFTIPTLPEGEKP